MSVWLRPMSWTNVSPCVNTRTRPNPGHPRQNPWPSTHIYPWKQPYTFGSCLEIKFKCVNLVFYATLCIIMWRIIRIEEENMAAFFNTETCTKNSFKNCILLIYFQCSPNRTQTQDKIHTLQFQFCFYSQYIGEIYIWSILLRARKRENAKRTIIIQIKSFFHFFELVLNLYFQMHYSDFADSRVWY